MQIVEAYAKWCDDYQEDQITVVYDTMWDGTKKLAHRITQELGKLSPDTKIKLFSIATTDKNDIMTEVFRSKAIAVGSPTVGQDILSSVGGWLHFLKELKLKGKKAAVFGCYGWSGEGNKVLRGLLTEAGFDVTDSEIKCNWNPTEEVLEEAKAVAESLV